MHLLIERSHLLKALGHVQNVVEKRGTIAILSHVKLDAKAGQVRLSATDMDLALVEKIPAQTEREGVVTLSAHMFYDIVRKLPDGAQVELATKDEGRISIVCGSSKFTLPTLPADEFPAIEEGEFPCHFTISTAECKALMEKPAYAMSAEETRYYLNGIFLHPAQSNGNDVLRAVATDGHRLAQVEVALPAGAAEMPGAIVPKKTIQELRKLLENAEGEVRVSVSASKIRFQVAGAALASKLVDGSFPDYQRVIPANNQKLMEVDCKTFIQAVDRVSVISSDRLRAVRLSLSQGKLGLAASGNEAGSATEEIEVKYSSDPVDIGFNSRYLLEMMGQIEGDTAQFLFNDSASPVLVRDTVDVGSLYVIMPMRV